MPEHEQESVSCSLGQQLTPVWVRLTLSEVDDAKTAHDAKPLKGEREHNRRDT